MRSASTKQHKAEAAATDRSRSVACAVITVSDTRTKGTDEGGDLVARLLEEAGHRVIDRAIVRDDADMIQVALETRLADPRLQAILTTGGTGIARRDTTIEVVKRLISAELPGFGELFRMLSWEQVGASAMLSRAVAGLAVHDAPSGPRGPAEGTFIFAMPGSVNAVETAMKRLIVPELSHLVWERR